MYIIRNNYQMVIFPIILFTVLFILWSSLMEISEFVRGYGKIVPSGQIKRVQHLEGGIVSDILVRQGEKVSVGQIIYKIRNEFAISNLSELQIDINSKLAQESRLRAELSGAEDIQFSIDIIDKYPDIVDNERKLFLQKKLNFKNSIDILEQQADQRRLQLQEDKARSKNLQLQYGYSMEQQQIFERLASSGASSQKELIDVKIKTQTLLTDLEDTKNRMLTNAKALEEANSRIQEGLTKNKLEVQTELSAVLLEIEKLKEQINANRDQVDRTEIVSPVDGVVKTISYNTVGGIIRPGDVVAEIIPTNDLLLVQARITPQDRARVWLGQEVHIRVSAYDTSINGQINGVLEEISADTFTDEGSGLPYYAVQVKANINDYGVKKPLYPGMIAEIDIISGKRTVAEYLLKPFLRVFSDALSEP